jgi:hypothetical protein
MKYGMAAGISRTGFAQQIFERFGGIGVKYRGQNFLFRQDNRNYRFHRSGF